MRSLEVLLEVGLLGTLTHLTPLCWLVNSSKQKIAVLSSSSTLVDSLDRQIQPKVSQKILLFLHRLLAVVKGVTGTGLQL